MEISEFKKAFSNLLNEAIFPSDVSNKEYFEYLIPIDNLVRANTRKSGSTNVNGD